MDSALAAQIQSGRRLKKATTNDRSAPAVAGNTSSAGFKPPLASAPRPPGAGSSSSASKPPWTNATNSTAPIPSSAGPPQLGGLFAGGMPTLRKTAPPISKPPATGPPSRAPPIPPVSTGLPLPSSSRPPPPVPQAAPVPTRNLTSPTIPSQAGLRHVRAVSALSDSSTRRAPVPPTRPNYNTSPPAPPARPRVITSLSSSAASFPPSPPPRPISPPSHGRAVPPPPPPRPQTSNEHGARPVPPPPPPRSSVLRNGSLVQKAPPPPPRPPIAVPASVGIQRPSSTPPRRPPAPPPPVVNGGGASSHSPSQPSRLPPPPPRPAPTLPSNLSASLPAANNPNILSPVKTLQPVVTSGISPAARARVMSTPPRPRVDYDSSSAGDQNSNDTTRRISMVAQGTLSSPSRRPPSPPTTYSVNPPRNFPGSENFPPPRKFTDGITHQYPSSKTRGCDWDYKVILV
ncbi:expressed protein [Phakopsora pachyrhizi]|uniref:Expressed protein n=1 Tax=Phakopsora pachyrhizi TaxID=170000 RepID=A0AAV0AYG3_PHAPC|nr:expressed protein [Phakopsora pachyrhizi]